MTLNVPRLNQPSQAPTRNPVGRPIRIEKPTPKPLHVQLPPPPKDIDEYQVITDPEENKDDEQQAPNQSQENPQQSNDSSKNFDTQEGSSKRRRSISDEGSREERIHSMITRSTVQKRPREPDDELPDAKHHRAFICMMKDLDPSMDWVDGLLECVAEVAFPAFAPGIAERQEVPIPKTYQEAIQDPKWGYM